MVFWEAIGRLIYRRPVMSRNPVTKCSPPSQAGSSETSMDTDAITPSSRATPSVDPSALGKRALWWARKKDDDKGEPRFRWMKDADNDYDAIAACLQAIEKSRERQDAQHEYFNMMLHGSFKSPVHEMLADGGAMALDIGCGVCSWTIENAIAYPRSDFHGVDIDRSAFPSPTILPRNFYPMIADITTGLPYDDNTFDLVFSRNMIVSVTKEDWPRIIAEFIRVCKPGGYIELTEPNFIFKNTGPKSARWIHEFHLVLESYSFDEMLGTRLAKLLDEASDFTTLQADYVSAPIGWGGPLGTLVLYDLQVLFTALREPMMDSMKMSSEEYSEWMEDCVQECIEYETFIDFYYAYGRKELRYY